MTEEEWLTSCDPRVLVPFVRDGARDRKLRLFACACCRRAWNVFVPPFAIRAVMVAEGFADSEVAMADLARVHAAASAAAEEHRFAPDGFDYLAHIVKAAADATHRHASAAAESAWRAAASAAADLPTTLTLAHDVPPEYWAERAAQADFLRDIFGNPFQSLEIQLEWLTSDVLALARGIYDQRAFDRMPILADALQDAGCDDDVILTHCREAREHVRGCWVVDLLLGKK